MQANPKVQERPDVSAAERTSHELGQRFHGLNHIRQLGKLIGRCG